MRGRVLAMWEIEWEAKQHRARAEREAKQWTDILLKRPCLATFTSRHQRRGYGHKRGPTERRFFNWQRTFFLLQ